MNAENEYSPEQWSLAAPPTARILDANVNRASEGLRVVEDYLRLGLNDRTLAQSCKAIRHELTDRTAKLPAAWPSRDSAGDVGRDVSTPQEREREAPSSVVIANLKRTQQAMRSLEEWSKVEHPEEAAGLEQLRYRLYDLESAVRRAMLRRDSLASCQLYVLVDGEETLARFTEKTRRLVDSGVHAIQLRDKRLTDVELLARGQIARQLTHAASIPLVVNDRPDIAAAVAADGVHLGQDDLPIEIARRVLGNHRMVGRSTHESQQVGQAVSEGADYLGAGPVYSSRTKEFDDFAGPDFAAEATKTAPLPVFAIGGITLHRLPNLLDKGVRRIAVGHAIWKSDDVGGTCKRFLDAISSVLVALLILLALTGRLSAESQLPDPARAGGTPNLSVAKFAHQQQHCLCELEKGAVTESSGLAEGRRKPGVLWTHNDSGDQPRLFAFDLAGKHLGTSKLRGAAAQDWEDMGAFAYNGHAYLFVADVGDNQRSREHCTIYVAAEPHSPKDDMKARAINFKYEDGPRNCEAVAFDPISKSFVLIEKHHGLRSSVYQLQWPRRAAETGVARKIGALDVPVVTGMDISPDGRRMAIATYGNGIEIVRHQNEPWQQAIIRGGKAVPLPIRRQGESICYSTNGKTLYLTSEKKPCPLFAISVANDDGT